MIRLNRLWLMVALAAALVLAPGAGAAPQADLWPRWQAHDPDAMRQIDHGAWEEFLLRYVRIGADGRGRVAYGEVTPADRSLLDGYIDRLAAAPISRYNRAEQLAYWINLYNALLVRVVLAHYPIASLRDLGGKSSPWTGTPWTEPRIEVEGMLVSLSDIEHRILRPIWQDPRVLYALSCGALGCPSLQPEPFRAERLEQQLNDAAMAYINDPGCIRMADEVLEVSSLFRWYEADFGGSERAIINHLMAYADPQLAMRLQKFNRITAAAFDWRLNDAAP
jgi:Protein of unknown function, DUF547